MINDIVKLLTVLSMFLQVSFDILQYRWDIDLYFYTCDDRIKWKKHLCGSWKLTMLWIITWWYHGMEIIFALWVLCEENPTVVPGGFPHKKVLMQRFHLFCIICLNKMLNNGIADDLRHHPTYVTSLKWQSVGQAIYFIVFFCSIIVVSLRWSVT